MKRKILTILIVNILIGIVGLMVSIGFVYLSAPDLAMTQFTVEVVTIILLLLALNYLPKATPVETTAARRLLDGAIALGAGIGVAALTWAFLSRDRALPAISDYHLANSYEGGGGNNVVNVILVDFRGFDTLGEITVVLLSLLAALPVLWALRPSTAGDGRPR